MYNRNFYLSRLLLWQDKPLIKIISGIRRAGKSTLLLLFMDHLKTMNSDASQIIYINKELLKFEYIRTYTDLYNLVDDQRNRVKKKIYLFVDEIQLIDGWEKAAASFLAEADVDMYVSGSNAHMFSAELATLLAGRYVEIPVFTLSYSEFLVFRDFKVSSDEIFNEFLEFGGMPGLHHLVWEKPVLYEYLNSVFDSIVLKDIVRRNNIRNVAFLEKIILFLLDNTGQVFSAKSVTDFLKSENRKANPETVYNYIQYLESAHIIQRISRFDLKGKRLLEVREKYYLTDIGLRHALLGYKKQDINQLLENIIYIELKKRGYKIQLGQIGTREIDFIIEKEGKKAYLQVAYLLASEATIEREFGALEIVNDNYPKYVLSLDKNFPGDRNGIKHLNIIEFLLNENAAF